ncbi:MAG: hypothetical protein HY558_01585 [Euryarchaeota archaeon]|nr:hypothetical protein [Euryarchaeota archaeon]
MKAHDDNPGEGHVPGESPEVALYRVLEKLQGRQTTVKIQFDDMEFQSGSLTLRLRGNLEFTLILGNKTE